MSIFKSTFKPYIKKQLEVRQNACSEVGRSIPKNIQYLNSKTAWIRLSSSVDVDSNSELARRLKLSGNDLAKKYVLQGGTLLLKDKNFYLRRGIGDGGGAYGDKVLGGPNQNWPKGGREELGIRPMPGITSISVENKSAYGSLREATINIECWSMSQLEELELLYMRPGYSVLLEWGWSLYLDNNGNLINTPPKYLNILDNSNGNLDKNKLFEAIKTQNENSNGNYDAMFGYVKNFTWSFKENGGFDCTVQIISIGEIIESLKLNYVTVDKGIVERNLFKLKLNDSEKKDIDKVYKSNKLKGTLVYLQKALSESGLGKNKTYSISFNEGKGNTYTTEYINLKFNFQDSSSNPNVKSTGIQSYIPLKFLVFLLNKFILLYDIKNNSPYVKISLDDENGVPLNCFAFYRQVPIDPKVCLIIPSSNNISSKLNKTTSIEIGPNFLNGLVSPQYNFFADENLNTGIIGNIFLNINNLIEIADNLSSNNEKGIVDLYSFLKEIMKQVQKSIGNINNFDIHVDGNSDTIRIIDLQFIEKKGDEIRAKDTVQLEIYGINSITRKGCSLQSSVFPSQATMIAISAQAGGGALGYNNSTFIKFNEGLIDRIIPIKDENISQVFSNTTKRIEDEISQAKINTEENFKNSETLLSQYFQSMNQPDHSVLTDQIEAVENILHDNIYYEISNGTNTIELDENKYKGIMPLKLTIPMDGISGIVIGEIFTIPENRLPMGYKSSGDFKVGFIVTGIQHSIQNSDWVTTLETQTCILKP